LAASKEEEMAENRDAERARDLAEKGIEAGTAGDIAKGERLIKQAQKIDKRATEEVAEEIDREREQARSHEYSRE